MQLQGKVAIITGAGTGLGKSVAELFLREGASVATIGRRPEKLQEAANEIRATDRNWLAVQGDISKPEDIKALVSRTIGKFGGVDIIVNNAGIHTKPYLTHDCPIEVFDAFINTNLRGPFLLVKEAVPSMLQRGGGSIVNVSSIVGYVGVKYCVAYGTAKGGMINMTRTIAMDYADKGIRVNCIVPSGMYPTENTLLFTEEDRRMMAEAIPRSPTGKPSRTEDVAQLVLLLVGPYGENITGAIIPHDGGYTAR